MLVLFLSIILAIYPHIVYVSIQHYLLQFFCVFSITQHNNR